MGDLMRAVLTEVDGNTPLDAPYVTTRVYYSSSYGVRRNGTNNWTGAVGELLRQETDIGVGLFPVTRRLVLSGIEYSVPVLTTGYSALVRLEPVQPGYWQFLAPYALQVWLAIIGMIVVSGLLTWGIDKFSPFGFYRTKGHPENRRGLDLRNSLWNGWLAFLGKDTQEVEGCASRLTILGLTLCAFFMLRAYTASLTAILTVRDLTTTINGWQDVRDRGLPFALVTGSTTDAYIRNSDDPAMAAMLQNAKYYGSLSDAIEGLRVGAVPAVIAESLLIKFARLTPPW
jgi:ionotropic glutamate receptor